MKQTVTFSAKKEQAKVRQCPRQQFHFMLKASETHSNVTRIKYTHFLLFNTLLSGANVWRFMENFPKIFIQRCSQLSGLLSLRFEYEKKKIFTLLTGKHKNKRKKQWIDRSERNSIRSNGAHRNLFISCYSKTCQ